MSIVFVDLNCLMLIALHYIEPTHVGESSWQPFDYSKHDGCHDGRVAIVGLWSVTGHDHLHGGEVARVVQFLEGRDHGKLFVVIILTPSECVSV